VLSCGPHGRQRLRKGAVFWGLEPHAREQNGFADAPKSDRQQALGQAPCPYPIDGDASALEGGVTAGRFRRPGAVSRAVGIGSCRRRQREIKESYLRLAGLNNLPEYLHTRVGPWTASCRAKAFVTFCGQALII